MTRSLWLIIVVVVVTQASAISAEFNPRDLDDPLLFVESVRELSVATDSTTTGSIEATSPGDAT